MRDKEKFNPSDYQTKKNDINYECKIDGDTVSYSEYGDNPHGVNSESTMTFIQFLTDDRKSRAIFCKPFIKQYFGEEKLERFIYFVQQQYDALKK